VTYICLNCNEEFTSKQVAGIPKKCPKGHRVTQLLSDSAATITALLAGLAAAWFLLSIAPIVGVVTTGPAGPIVKIMVSLALVATVLGIVGILAGTRAAKRGLPARKLAFMNFAGGAAVLAATVIVLVVWYVRLAVPVDIGTVKFGEVSSEVSIEGRVSGFEPGSDGVYYTVTDERQSISVRAGDSDNVPRVGDRVWVLGHVGAASNTGERLLAEQFRRHR